MLKHSTVTVNFRGRARTPKCNMLCKCNDWALEILVSVSGRQERLLIQLVRSCLDLVDVTKGTHGQEGEVRPMQRQKVCLGCWTWTDWRQYSLTIARIEDVGPHGMAVMREPDHDHEDFCVVAMIFMIK